VPETTKPAADASAEPAHPEPTHTGPENESESEAGDFITRNVLEKDTVFFEG